MKSFKSYPLLFFTAFVLSVVMTKVTPVLGDEKGKKYQRAVKFFNEGNNFSAKNNYQQAIVSYRKSIQINSLLPAPHYNLGNVLLAIGEYEEAVKEYQVAIKISPMVADYHRNLGFAYALLKKGELAKKKYQELKALDPDKAKVLMEWIKKGRKYE